MDDETQAGWEEKMTADEKYIEDLEKAYSLLKMENAALVNLIGAIVCDGTTHDVLDGKRVSIVAQEAMLVSYNVNTEPAEGCVNITAEPRQQDDE